MASNGKGYSQDTDDDSRGLLAKISMASALEQAGHTNDARVLYQEVASADPSGTIGASARRALEALNTSTTSEDSLIDLQTNVNVIDVSGVSENHSGSADYRGNTSKSLVAIRPRLRLLQRLYNLPISGKQLLTLILSELLVLGLLGISAAAIVQSWRSQLVRQSKSELAVLQLAYEVNINQIGVGVRGQSDNQAVIAAAKTFQTTVRIFDDGYGAVYLYHPNDARGEFRLAASEEKVGNKPTSNARLPSMELLARAVNAQGELVIEQVKIGENAYTMAARTLPNSVGTTTLLVRGTPEAGSSKLLSGSLWLLLALTIVAIGLNILLAVASSQVIAEPIKQLLETAQRFIEGDKSARAEVLTKDEVGQLAHSFNHMAEMINISDSIMAEQESQRQSELDFHRQENERLQQKVIKLLLDIEGAKLGDLTVRAQVDDGEMGSIADAFNTTIHSLSQLVTQVQTATNQVHQSAFKSEASVRRLSQEATTQADVISVTLNSVAEMVQSIQSVADSAQEAAVIARKALLAAQEGWETMDETVRSIQNIRTSVTETSKKVKRLAESSQEIYKIVSIISGISEKTNILAFNASIEAARAGKNGQGFRVVADEVRRLAERVTNSTKEIEQLVSTIQQETAEVLQTMDQSTKQVVTGTKLVAKTKQTLENLALISQKIDQLLQSISVSTVSQTQASKMVNQTMEEVAAIAKNTSFESESVSSALKALVAVAEELQGYMAKFRVER